MKRRTLLMTFTAVLFIGGIYAFSIADVTTADKEMEELKWYTLEEAVEANKTNKKKILIDIYTDWCHWCKVMDKQTFTDAAVKKYLNENFYAVKFNGEHKENITFQGKEYKFVNAGRRGINTLAYFLLDGRAAYPTIVYLDENLDKVKVSPGFKKPGQLMDELKLVESMGIAN